MFSSCKIHSVLFKRIISIVVLHFCAVLHLKWRARLRIQCLFSPHKSLQMTYGSSQTFKEIEDNQKDKCDGPPVWGTRWMWNSASVLWCLWPESSKLLLDSGPPFSVWAAPQTKALFIIEWIHHIVPLSWTQPFQQGGHFPDLAKAYYVPTNTSHTGMILKSG